MYVLMTEYIYAHMKSLCLKLLAALNFTATRSVSVAEQSKEPNLSRCLDLIGATRWCNKETLAYQNHRKENLSMLLPQMLNALLTFEASLPSRDQAGKKSNKKTKTRARRPNLRNMEEKDKLNQTKKKETLKA
jgi:hypothetical protein